MATDSQESSESYGLTKDPCGWQFCPICGESLEKETFPVGSVEGPGGELIPTKFNSRAMCPNHGELYLFG